MAKYVLSFNPDYDANSLWTRNDEASEAFGWNPEYEKLELSKELIEDLRKFDRWIYSLVDWEGPGKEEDEMPYEEHVRLFETGKQLIERVRRELGDDFEIEDNMGWIDPARRYDQQIKE